MFAFKFFKFMKNQAAEIRSSILTSDFRKLNARDKCFSDLWAQGFKKMKTTHLTSKNMWLPLSYNEMETCGKPIQHLVSFWL